MPIVNFRQRAEQWRERAIELRVVASELRDTEKQSFLAVADEWAAMADQADRLFKVSQTIGSRVS